MCVVCVPGTCVVLRVGCKESVLCVGCKESVLYVGCTESVLCCCACMRTGLNHIIRTLHALYTPSIRMLKTR